MTHQGLSERPYERVICSTCASKGEGRGVLTFSCKALSQPLPGARLLCNKTQNKTDAFVSAQQRQQAKGRSMHAKITPHFSSTSCAYKKALRTRPGGGADADATGWLAPRCTHGEPQSLIRCLNSQPFISGMLLSRLQSATTLLLADSIRPPWTAGSLCTPQGGPVAAGTPDCRARRPPPRMLPLESRMRIPGGGPYASTVTKLTTNRTRQQQSHQNQTVHKASSASAARGDPLPYSARRQQRTQHDTSPVSPKAKPAANWQQANCAVNGSSKPASRASSRGLGLEAAPRGPAGWASVLRGRQGTLDGQELVANGLAVQVLDDVVCQHDVPQLRKCVPLQTVPGKQSVMRGIQQADWRRQRWRSSRGYLGVAGVLVHDQVEGFELSERLQYLLHLRSKQTRVLSRAQVEAADSGQAACKGGAPPGPRSSRTAARR